MWKWFDSEIIKITDISPQTKQFSVQVAENIEFTAGQFVTFDLPISEKRLKRWRSYSIANSPNPASRNILEFCIVRAHEGLGTKYFFEEARVGTPLKFKGPDGNFILKNLKDGALQHDVVFICTGTGVAPFRSMLWDIYNQKIPHKKIHLIFGTRYESGILYREEFEVLEKLLPNFRFDVALSREEKIGFQKGYIHPIYLTAYAEKRKDVEFYICGWSAMIDETLENLMVNLGYDRTQVHYELYG
jgi:ferredoxin-NADP reductase